MDAVTSHRSPGPAPGAPPGSLYFLRVSPDRWDDMEIDHLGRPAATVLGAWALLAWARFGPQLIDDMRAVLRFVLVGVYGWLALSVLIFLALRVLNRRTDGLDPTPLSLEATTAKVGLAHQALAVGGFAMQIFQILPFPIVTSVIAVTSVIWMGAQLTGAVASLQQRQWLATAPLAMTAWLAWLAVIGTYLWSRLGHLV